MALNLIFHLANLNCKCMQQLTDIENMRSWIIYIWWSIVNVSIILRTIALWRQWIPVNSTLNSVLKTNKKWLRYALNKIWFYIVIIWMLTIDDLIKRAHTSNLKNHRIRHLGPTNIPFNGIPSMSSLNICCYLFLKVCKYYIWVFLCSKTTQAL